MPSTKASRDARSRIIEQLIEDHKRVKKAYRDFQKLDAEGDPEGCEAIVQQVLQELQVHTALEEELLYPAAREALEADLIDEAEVEHESAHTLMEQLASMSPGDEKYTARFTVLCEYVMHHVKEEEKEMFPQLESARGIDWESMETAFDARRAELEGSEDEGEEGGDTEAAEGHDDRDDTRPQQPERGRGKREPRSLAGVAPTGAAGSRRMGG